MKMEHDKTQPGGVGPEHLVFITACQTSFFLSTWGLGTGGSSVSFLLRTMPSITPVDPESIIIPVCVCVCDSPRPRHWPTSWCAGRIAHSWCHTPGRFPEERRRRTRNRTNFQITSGSCLKMCSVSQAAFQINTFRNIIMIPVNKPDHRLGRQTPPPTVQFALWAASLRRDLLCCVSAEQKQATFLPISISVPVSGKWTIQFEPV